MPTATTMKFNTMSAQSGLYMPMSKDSPLLTNGLEHRSTYHDEEGRKFLRDFFHREPCLYSHKIYKQAAAVFDSLKLEAREYDPYMQRLQQNRTKTNNKEMPNVEFDSDSEKRLAYEIVFTTLKYQRFLEDILEDCQFFTQYPEFRDDHGLVLVMFNDFKERKFQMRTTLNGEELDPYLTDIEHSLQGCKTKLNAALARRRIKAQVLSIDELLPHSVRQSDKVVPRMQVYCWVNQLKTNFNTVLECLHDEGFTAAYTHHELTGQSYMRDQQCNDAIMLPSDQRDWLQDHPMVQEGHIVIQDKSSCLGPQCIQQLLNEGDDVVQVNVGSGLSLAHLASITHNMDTTIYAFGVHSEKQHNQVTYNLERLGATSRVKLLCERLEDIDLNDDRFKNIKVALLPAECSRSGVADPVNFLVTEGEDMTILKSLSQGEKQDVRLGELVMRHNRLLTHLLKFPRMQAVIYCTRSLNEAENESVVIRAIEYANMVQKKGTNFRVAPPVLPLSQMDIEGDGILSGKYLRYRPSAHMSGCFIATVTREAVDPKEAAKEVLARAAAKGLITGVPPEALKKAPKVTASQPTTQKKGQARKKGSQPKRSKSQPNKAGPRSMPVGAALPTLQTMSVPSAQATIQPFSQNTAVRTQPVHPTMFAGPVPFGVTQTQPKRQVQATPEHRKVVHHPKPFRCF